MVERVINIVDILVDTGFSETLVERCSCIEKILIFLSFGYVERYLITSAVALEEVTIDIFIALMFFILP